MAQKPQRVVVATATTPSGSRPAARSDWAVIATYRQAESTACRNLERQGYATFLPTALVPRRDRVVRSMVHNVVVPLFSGYAFVRISPTDPWRPITYTPGVYDLLRDATGKPRYMFAGAVEALEASEHVRRTPTPPDALWSPGRACGLSEGAFRGHGAVVVSVAGESAVVSVLMLGQLRDLCVPLRWLRELVG